MYETSSRVTDLCWPHGSGLTWFTATMIMHALQLLQQTLFDWRSCWCSRKSGDLKRGSPVTATGGGDRTDVACVRLLAHGYLATKFEVDWLRNATSTRRDTCTYPRSCCRFWQALHVVHVVNCLSYWYVAIPGGVFGVSGYEVVSWDSKALDMGMMRWSWWTPCSVGVMKCNYVSGSWNDDVRMIELVKSGLRNLVI